MWIEAALWGWPETTRLLFESVVCERDGNERSGRELMSEEREVFSTLGLPAPETEEILEENRKQVAAAVRDLKKMGVFLPESCDRPRAENGRPACYVWRIARGWTFPARQDVACSRVSVEGTRIRIARRNAGMTLEQFASRFGRSKSFWWHVEHGRRPVPADAQAVLALFLLEYGAASGLEQYRPPPGMFRTNRE